MPPESQWQTSTPWSACILGTNKPVSTAWPCRNQSLCALPWMLRPQAKGWQQKWVEDEVLQFSSFSYGIPQLCGGCWANKKQADSWLCFSWHKPCKAQTMGHFLCWAKICLAHPWGGSWGSPGLLSDPPAGSQPGPARTSLVWSQALSQKQLSWSKQWSRKKSWATEDPHHWMQNPSPRTVSKHPDDTGEHKGTTHMAKGLWSSVCRDPGSGVQAGSFSLKIKIIIKKKFKNREKKRKCKPCPFRELPKEMGCL